MSDPKKTLSTGRPWSPLAFPLFRMMWIAALISQVGTWMHDLGSGWLMTQLTRSSLEVALIQTAFTLPIFLLALPAGTLADIVNRRRYLIVAISGTAAIAAVMGLLTLAGKITPVTLLGLTFCLGIGNAMIGPAWAASVPDFIPRPELRGAITLNAMSMNTARAIGPIAAGYVILAVGPGIVYLLNAVTFIVLLAAIVRWREPPAAGPATLPVERMFGGMRAGLRYARHEPALRAVLIKGVTITAFAGITWALLPVLGIRELGLDAHTYGFLAASVGAGAIGGALILPRFHDHLSRNAIFVYSAIVSALTLAAMVMTRNLVLVAAILLINGAAWLWMFSSLVVAAQLSVPDWVRARGLALTMLAVFGSLAAGSAIWGRVADEFGVQAAFLAAAGGIILGLLLTARVRIRDDQHMDQMATSQFPLPEFADDIETDRGPVLVSIEFEVPLENQDEFLRLMREMRRVRLRDGAFFWEVFSDPKHPRRLTEIFMINSWLDRLRQHQRGTVADQSLRDRIRALHAGTERPRVTYLIASEGGAPELALRTRGVQEI